MRQYVPSPLLYRQHNNAEEENLDRENFRYYDLNEHSVFIPSAIHLQVKISWKSMEDLAKRTKILYFGMYLSRQIEMLYFFLFGDSKMLLCKRNDSIFLNIMF